MPRCKDIGDGLLGAEVGCHCVLFGDGAAAALVTDSGPGLLVQDVSIETDGSQAELIKLPGGGARHPASEETIKCAMHYLTMNGRETFKHAVRCMGAISQQSLERKGLTEADVSWIVPHQANMRIIEALAKRFSLPMEKVYTTVHKYGNTSASAVAIALEELMQGEEIPNGTNILLTAFGSGLTYGAAVLTQHND